MRNKFIAGNWKMNCGRSETRDLINALIDKVKGATKTTILVAPPYTNLETAAALVKNTNLHLGAQNVFWEEKGAFTGEISPAMLKEVGCEYVIVGHSERRQFFGETDQTVNRRINAVIRHGMLPIVCVGETLGQREAGQTLEVVEEQIRECLLGFSAEQVSTFTIAYEPVWAIGTGRAATVQDALEVHQHIRALLAEIFGNACAQSIRIQYGGSVTADNIDGLIREADIDGALVGGASLKADVFAKIVAGAEKVSS